MFARPALSGSSALTWPPTIGTVSTTLTIGTPTTGIITTLTTGITTGTTPTMAITVIIITTMLAKHGW
jgi:hypothetical protein